MSASPVSPLAPVAPGAGNANSTVGNANSAKPLITKSQLTTKMQKLMETPDFLECIIRAINGEPAVNDRAEPGSGGGRRMTKKNKNRKNRKRTDRKRR